MGVQMAVHQWGTMTPTIPLELLSMLLILREEQAIHSLIRIKCIRQTVKMEGTIEKFQIQETQRVIWLANTDIRSTRPLKKQQDFMCKIMWLEEATNGLLMWINKESNIIDVKLKNNRENDPYNFDDHLLIYQSIKHKSQMLSMAAWLLQHLSV